MMAVSFWWLQRELEEVTFGEILFSAAPGWELRELGRTQFPVSPLTPPRAAPSSENNGERIPWNCWRGENKSFPAFL